MGCRNLMIILSFPPGKKHFGDVLNYFAFIYILLTRFWILCSHNHKNLQKRDNTNGSRCHVYLTSIASNICWSRQAKVPHKNCVLFYSDRNLLYTAVFNITCSYTSWLCLNVNAVLFLFWETVSIVNGCNFLITNITLIANDFFFYIWSFGKESILTWRCHY